jgi:hypothetical protein
MTACAVKRGEREATEATQALRQPSHSLHRARPQPPSSNPAASSQIRSPDAATRRQPPRRIRPPALRGGGGGGGKLPRPPRPPRCSASPRTASTARAHSHRRRIRPPGTAINAKHELTAWPSQPSTRPLQVADPDWIRMPTVHLLSIGRHP